MANAIITSVYGNLLRLRIPLTLRVINNEGETPVATDADFIPNAGYPVMVIFADRAKSHRYDAVMDGNVAGVDVKGDLPIGTWSLAILCRDEDGNPMRFAQSNVVKVVNYSAQAGLDPGIEFQGEVHVLDAAVHSVSGMIKGDPGEPGPAGPKGDKGDPGVPGVDGRDGTDGVDGSNGRDGVGIDDVTVTESQEDGGANTIAIELTDGRIRTFTVLNGSGSDGGYVPPVGGIPKSDLAQSVQDTLDDVDNKVDKESGKSLMTDAEHTKLAGIAAGAEVNVQPNWTQTNTSADDYIKNKPTLATVATSGSYNDLQDKPTIPAAYDDTTLSGRVSALENAGFITTETDPTVPSWAKQSSKPTYTAQEVGALPSSTTIPSKTSDLTNDSGFIDKAMYYGESTTAAATMPKVCTVETFPTTTSGNVTHAKGGTIIAVKFTNSDTNTTDAPSLNVNGIGAKAIMYNNAIVTSTAKNTTVAGTAKMLAYYRYDPALDEGNGAWEFLAKSVDSNSTYSNASLGQGYGTQSNSSAATAITSSISSYALSSGGIVTIKFTYDVPANATLNINSKGAKAIYNQGAAITAGVIKAGDTATFVYSTYYHLIAVDSWQDKQDAISDLATIRSGAAAGATAAQPADIPTKVSDLTNDSGFTSNAGTITGITMNGASKGTSGVVNLGTVITAHQDISGKANASEVYTKTQTDTLLAGKQNTLTFDSTPTASSTNPVTSGGVKTYVDGKATITGITTSQDGTFTIALSDGNSYTVYLNHVHPQYAAQKTVESNTDATVTLSADVIYNLGTVAGNKTINLPTTVDQAADYEFRLSYTSGTISGTAISGTTVANDATLTFTAGKTYQVIISGGILYFSETTVSA